MTTEIDTVNPDDLVIGLVQIPPGKSSTELLDTSNPAVLKFLRKFCKRLGKNPERKFTKRLPTNFESESFSISTRGSAPVHISFVGKGSGGRWYLRHFPTQRLTVQQCDNVANTQLDLSNEQEPSQAEPIGIQDASMSPQLITSSDEDEQDGVDLNGSPE